MCLLAIAVHAHPLLVFVAVHNREEDLVRRVRSSRGVSLSWMRHSPAAV
jgi:hypothetical protein